MSSSADLHLAYKIGNAPLNLFPFPHFYVENVFPQDLYDQIQAMMPDPQAMLPIADVRPVRGYKERFVMEFQGDQLDALPEDQRAFWTQLHRSMVGGRFGQHVIAKFKTFIEQRFGSDADVELYDETLLVQDITNYALGPHSDAPRKVITFLFYLPKDQSQRHLGTSIYVPKDPAFRCPGGPHYKHEMFERVWTFPFVPNSLFAFVKSDNSFHGVEPVTDEDCRRWLLLYDLYVRDYRVRPPQAPAAGTVRFSF